MKRAQAALKVRLFWARAAGLNEGGGGCPRSLRRPGGAPVDAAPSPRSYARTHANPTKQCQTCPNFFVIVCKSADTQLRPLRNDRVIRKGEVVRTRCDPVRPYSPVLSGGRRVDAASSLSLITCIVRCDWNFNLNLLFLVLLLRAESFLVILFCYHFFCT